MGAPIATLPEDPIPTATAEVLGERCGNSKSKIRDESILPLEFYDEDPIPTATAEVLWECCER